MSTSRKSKTNNDIRKENLLCELCSFLCKDETEFENHLNIHVATKCEVIQTIYASPENNKESVLYVEVYKTCINSKAECNDNVEINLSAKRNFFCEKCNLTFLTSEEFSAHNSSHISNDELKQNNIEQKKPSNGVEIPTQCEICEKLFSRMGNLSSHFVTHTNDFHCFVCCNSYRTQFKLDQHMMEHSERELSFRKDNPLLLKCPYDCEEVFNSKLKLFKHKKYHENVTEFECDQCDKKFETFRRLETHKKKHEENTSCLICGKHLSNQKTLKDHLRLHSGEKPFQCKICNHRFRCQSGLKSHETIHTGKRNYKCGQCSRTFARSNYLKDHMRIHLNEKPFQCQFCTSTFTQRSVLNTHISKKHRHCSECKKHVGGALQLRMHIWKCHKNQKCESVSSSNNEEFLVEENVGNSADEQASVD